MKYNHEEKRMEFNKNEYYRFFTVSIDEALFKGRAYLKNRDYDDPHNRRIEEIAYEGFVYYLNRVIHTSHEYLNAGGLRPLHKKLSELNELFLKVSRKHTERRENYWKAGF